MFKIERGRAKNKKRKEENHCYNYVNINKYLHIKTSYLVNAHLEETHLFIHLYIY